jgi:two-component sensor histidine kinase
VEKARAVERQKLLNYELSHRLKNTLAMVQAIIAQTLRNAPDLDTAKQALGERMVALGRAHDLLLRGEREAADVRELILGATRLHSDEQAGRFRISGPELVVGSRAALALALMVHELATNAIKYGALSVSGAHVDIAWATQEVEGETTFSLTWTERGGPAVAVPSRRGFGSRLIERGLAGQIGGTVSLRFEPEGVVCVLDAPLLAFQTD